MNFSPSDYLDRVKDYKDNWQLLDNWLYALCKKHPAHSSAAEVNAKLWIVGRTYATQIERIVSSSGRPMQGSLMRKSLTKVAELILSRGAQLDELFATLRTEDEDEPLSDTKLRKILDVHGKFVRMLATVTDGKAVTTFAAKYLHFHHPVAPIYDRLAADKITKIVGSPCHYSFQINRIATQITAGI
jgi:hypothetical protein